MSSENISITVVGIGAVGSALIDFFKSNGYPVISAFDSSSELPGEPTEFGNLIFISTPDDAIEPVAVKLANSEINWSGKIVTHCSGSLSSDKLSSLGLAGAYTASMHPIQTFKKGDRADRFENITISIEGTEQAKAVLKPLISRMKAKAIDVTPGQKQALHIGAVFASNYLVSLLHTVEKYLESEEIEDGIHIMKPLIVQTLRNIFEEGTAESLTGPVSRGDVQTVETHLSRLIFHPDEQALYRQLGKSALQIAKENDQLSADAAEKLTELFDFDA
jgi:predicted short-subunit dehydrogenase-like oxidoreductase (DUF2520 family)